MEEPMGVVVSRMSTMRTLLVLLVDDRAGSMPAAHSRGEWSLKGEPPMTARLRPAVLIVLALAAAGVPMSRALTAPPPAPAAATAPADALSPARVAAVRAYIKNAWTTLSRSTRDLAKAAPDPKFPRAAGQPWPVYLPAE